VACSSEIDWLKLCLSLVSNSVSDWTVSDIRYLGTLETSGVVESKNWDE